MSKDLVTRWFNKISPVEQNMPLLVLSGLAYTPRQTLDEVTRGTPIGDQLQKLIEAGRFGTAMEDESALIKMRLKMSLQAKPQDKPLFVALPTSGVQPKAFTPAQLLQEIESGSSIGKQWINNEASYMRRLLQVR
jgi:hypothetical protein